ncbi:MAG: 1,4-alpha-glucan branching protein GlgB [Proteobacteria bacterium]|nr:1,4-alpha-glucan branching protein GlgB [Pseudomonadota bacterium]
MSNHPRILHDVSTLTDQDIYLFKEGNHFRLYEKLGSHRMTVAGQKGIHFAVWAPNAAEVSVTGDFNEWDTASHPLKIRADDTGIWEGFIPEIGKDVLYKYHISSRYECYQADKGDPFAFLWQVAPKTASVVSDLDYDWQDTDWMKNRRQNNSLSSPIAVYEIHPGSWRRVPEENNRPLTYREMAEYLPEYVRDMGFTHVEFTPVTEHPFYGSWGYQTIGYFAPTSRYGTPQDFMFLIDCLHQYGIGVFLDWVPASFPDDLHGLVFFDGTHLYEHANPKKGFHPDWNSYIFNYSRNEVRAFLGSSAVFWLEKYHADGLRIDAVASMLYLDYGREEGKWIPNVYGGNENIEAIAFLRKLNEEVYREFPDVQTIAEESTAWPMVSRPVYTGGLGFGMKWNMGWMHDILEYFSKEPVFRKYHHNQLIFSILYAFTENFMLSLSHDEAVYGKGSLLNKMPGDDWQKFANLRLLLGYMYAHPGKKLLFMGGEFGQGKEWAHEDSLDWHLLQFSGHKGVQSWLKQLHILYRGEPALHELDCQPAGFEWVDCTDWEKSIISFLRKGKTPGDSILVICNFTPVTRDNYRVGVPSAGYWKEMLNSDAGEYGGSGQGNLGGVEATTVPCHGRCYSLSLVIPPLGIVFLKNESTIELCKKTEISLAHAAERTENAFEAEQ